MPAPDPDISTEVGPGVVATAVEHARRGVRLQVALRWVLVGFVALTVLTVRPAHDATTCAVIAVLYALGAGRGAVGAPPARVVPGGLARAVRGRRRARRAHPADRRHHPAELDLRCVHHRVPAGPGAGRDPAAAGGVRRGRGPDGAGLP